MFRRLKEEWTLRALNKQEGKLITDDAYRMLSFWGFSHQHIEELQKIMRTFDKSYGNCIQKVQALRVLHTIGQDHETEVLLPTLEKGQLLTLGSNCRDISVALIELITESQIIDAVNQTRDTPIELRIMRGTNATHFKKGTHVWVGLVEKGNEKSKDVVVLDGSYQEFSLLKTNGYRIHKTDFVENIPVATDRKLLRSLIDMQPDSIEVIRPYTFVLGVSADKSVSFLIGFAVSWNHVHINIPFIKVSHMNGNDEAIFLINPNSGNLNYEFSYAPFTLIPSSQAELTEMLDIAQGIQFIPTDRSSV